MLAQYGFLVCYRKDKLMLDKTFEATEVEKKHYPKWEESGGFSADVNSNRAPYTIP